MEHTVNLDLVKFIDNVMFVSEISLDKRLKLLDGYMEVCFICDMSNDKRRQKMIGFLEYLSQVKDVKTINYLD